MQLQLFNGAFDIYITELQLTRVWKVPDELADYCSVIDLLLGIQHITIRIHFRVQWYACSHGSTAL